MIDCENGELRDLLPDYLHDRLDASTRTLVERHVAECSPCQDELALLRDLRGTLHRAPRIDVAAVAAAIPAYRPAARTRWASGWRIAAAIGAIVVGGAALTFLGRGGTPAQIARAPITAPATRVPDVGGPTSPASAPRVAQQPTPTPEPAVAPAPPAVKSAPAPKGEELAMAGGTIADLSDGELSDLIGDLESLDAVPSADVESTESFLTGRHRGRHD
jgi:anti-sigma factor RsiW